ncbi:MAG: NUDIX domain-containing protein [Candidatus Woesearchaeota archaeon]
MNTKDGRYPRMAVDAIIEYYENQDYKNKSHENHGDDSASPVGIVLIDRKYHPKKVALPGGMVEYELSTGTNVVNECREETGLEVIVDDEKKPFLLNSAPNRDPRWHIISATYIVKGSGELKPDPKEDAKRAWVCTYTQLKSMLGKSIFAFDHEEIIIAYMKHKRIYN